MIEIVGVSEIFGILKDAAAIVQELGSVDHIGDFGNVELIQLSEWSENVKSLLFVGGDFTVQNFYGLVGFSQINLAVVAQIAVIMQRGDALSVTGNHRALHGQSANKSSVMRERSWPWENIFSTHTWETILERFLTDEED